MLKSVCTSNRGNWFIAEP